MVAKGEGGVGAKDWESGISRGNHIGWINKFLLHSAGNCIQHPVINHNGIEYEKEYL